MLSIDDSPTAAPRQSELQNRLLTRMRPQDYARLQPQLTPVELPRGFVMVEEGAPVECVYFLESGIGSVVAISPEGHKVEAGIFGREGMSPVSGVLGVRTPNEREFMQVGGAGHTLDYSVFRQSLDESAHLRELLNAYAYTVLVQTSYTALSNAVHLIDERLSRWLLMCDDRNDGPEIAITHEFIAVMLGVRRPSVTTALHTLEGNGFIRSKRGLVTITNRAALEEFAGDAYGAAEKEYRRLLGPI